jgi:adenylylsulfate kinase
LSANTAYRRDTVSNIVWHSGKVDRAMREQILGQKAKVLWFTGLSGSGKSTLANALEEKLNKSGKLTYLLDGDNLRFGINSDLGFSLEDRAENIRRVSEISKLFVDSGTITLCTFVSPTRTVREKVRDSLGDDFIEIYVKCSIDECKERDPKGLYKKAVAGEISDFTGIDSPYEHPLSPEITLDTEKHSIDELTDIMLSYLSERGVF